LEREARHFRRLCPSVPVVITQVGVARAKLAIETLLSRSTPKLVILAGYGGALTDSSKIGDVIVAKDVIDESGNAYACVAVPGAAGRVLTVNRMIATAEEKRALGLAHGAAVCDMESAAVAAVCQAKGVPFLAVRAISDDATCSLPAELDDIIQNGRVSVRRLIITIIRKPGIVREFRKLHCDTQLAGERLGEALHGIIGLWK
jgi:adenosylhomocysteine nucleosidase